MAIIKSKYFRVQEADTGSITIVKAMTDAQVRAHLCATRFDIRVASQDDLVELLPAPIEVAGEEIVLPVATNGRDPDQPGSAADDAMPEFAQHSGPLGG